MVSLSLQQVHRFDSDWKENGCKSRDVEIIQWKQWEKKNYTCRISISIMVYVVVVEWRSLTVFPLKFTHNREIRRNRDSSETLTLKNCLRINCTEMHTKQNARSTLDANNLSIHKLIHIMWTSADDILLFYSDYFDSSYKLHSLISRANQNHSHWFW